MTGGSFASITRQSSAHRPGIKRDRPGKRPRSIIERIAKHLEGIGEAIHRIQSGAHRVRHFEARESPPPQHSRITCPSLLRSGRTGMARVNQGRLLRRWASTDYPIEPSVTINLPGFQVGSPGQEKASSRPPLVIGVFSLAAFTKSPYDRATAYFTGLRFWVTVRHGLPQDNHQTCARTIHTAGSQTPRLCIRRGCHHSS